MENYIERLINIGYPPDNAKDLYDLYLKNNELENLTSYIACKETLINAQKAMLKQVDD